MSDAALEISTDYDHDYIDTRELDQEFADLSTIRSEIDQLVSTVGSVETYGISYSSFSVMKLTGLLGSTALESLTVQEMGSGDAGSPEAEMAMESLIEKAKEKAAEWAARILAFVKNVKTTVVDGLASIWTKISEKGRALVDSSWDKLQDVKTYVKAHPYKSVAIALAAVIAVAGIATLVASGMPGAYANKSALTSFAHKVADAAKAIKLPGGKIVTSVGENGKTVTTINNVLPSRELGNPAKIGWTKSAVQATMAQASKGWTSIKTGATAFTSKIGGAAKFADDVGNAVQFASDKVTEKTKSKFGGWAAKKVIEKLYETVLWSVVGTVYLLLKDVVLKAYQMVNDSFTSLHSKTKTA